MEDIRIGRQEGASETNVICGATSTVLLPPDPHRTAVIIYPPVSGTLTLSTLSPVVAGVGITLQAAYHPVRYNLKDDGLIVTKGFYGIHSVGGITICCHESRLPIE